MFNVIRSLILPTFLAVSLVATAGIVSPALAAEFKTGSTITLDNAEEPLENAYVAGESVSITAPSETDLVVAGSRVSINNQTEGSVWAAGNEVSIDGRVTNSARLAGSRVSVNGSVSGDVLIFAAEAVINSTAEIKGDLVFAGGRLTVNGPVDGDVILNCDCVVTIHSEIGSVDAEKVGALTLGSEAVVARGMNYASDTQAVIENGADVRGSVNYEHASSNNLSRSIGSFSFFYGVLSSLIFAIALLWLVRRAVDTSITAVRQNGLLTFGVGLATIVFMLPVAFLLLLLSSWLGGSLILLYFLLMVVAYGLAQLLIGWWLLQWWFGRNQQAYDLDWRAAIIGVLATTILSLAQIFGWFIIFLAMIMAIGGLIQSLLSLRAGEPAS